MSGKKRTRIGKPKVPQDEEPSEEETEEEEDEDEEDEEEVIPVSFQLVRNIAQYSITINLASAATIHAALNNTNAPLPPEVQQEGETLDEVHQASSEMFRFHLLTVAKDKKLELADTYPTVGPFSKSGLAFSNVTLAQYMQFVDALQFPGWNCDPQVGIFLVGGPGGALRVLDFGPFRRSIPPVASAVEEDGDESD